VLLEILNDKYSNNIVNDVCFDCHNKKNKLCDKSSLLGGINFFQLTNLIRKYGDSLIEKLPDNIKNDKNIKKGLGSPDLVNIGNDYIIFIENTKNEHNKLIKWYNHDKMQVIKIKEIEYKICGINLFFKSLYSDYNVNDYKENNRIIIILIPKDLENTNFIKLKNMINKFGNILTVDNIKYRKERVKCENYKEIENLIKKKEVTELPLSP
jgi:hypothetical protein